MRGKRVKVMGWEERLKRQALPWQIGVISLERQAASKSRVQKAREQISPTLSKGPITLPTPLFQWPRPV